MSLSVFATPLLLIFLLITLNSFSPACLNCLTSVFIFLFKVYFPIDLFRRLISFIYFSPGCSNYFVYLCFEVWGLWSSVGYCSFE